MSNSINQVIRLLKNDPFLTETQIQDRCWGYHRKYSRGSNKKYADLLRRGLQSGRILRAPVKFKGDRSRYVYYLSDSWMRDY